MHILDIQMKDNESQYFTGRRNVQSRISAERMLVNSQEYFCRRQQKRAGKPKEQEKQQGVGARNRWNRLDGRP